MPERQEDAPSNQPTFEQANKAGMMLVDYYGTFSKFGRLVDPSEDGETLTETEIAERLTGLASGITEGTVTSHREVAMAIQNLGPVIGPFWSNTT